MGVTPRGARTLTLLGLLAVALVAAIAVPSAATATPTDPGLRDATVYQGGAGVTVGWIGSTDTEAGAIQYEVYRDDVPMTIVTYQANGELVLTTTDTTVTVTPRANEAIKKFTYYYMVVATNLTTGKKAVSTNIAPNVHGGLRTGMPTYNCQLCHNVHGAPPEGYLGAASRYQCYRCHGNTSGTTAYGDKAIANVQKDFYDYTSGQTIPTNVSRHYNQFMEDAQTECTSCHTPHKSPHYVNPGTGLKDDANSYTQLLRAERADATYFYSKDGAIARNAFCYECHGTNTTTLDYNAGAGAYDRTAGDHNQANYATSAAHGDTQVYANADSHGTNPAIQCEACHNKHASAADKLIAYRNDDSSSTSADGTYAQAELCYSCHSAAGYSAEIAAATATGNTNFAWNSRDIKVQFAKTSHHPTAARVGSAVAVSNSWSQTNSADFGLDTLVNATIVNGPTSAAQVELAKVGGADSGIFSDAFASLSNWTNVGTYWQINTAQGSTLPGGSGVNSARGYSDGSTRTSYLVKAISVSGRTNIRLAFSYMTTGLETTDYLNAQYTTNGTTWTTLVSINTANAPWTRSASYTIPATATQIRFTSYLNATAEYVYVDDVAVTADAIPYQYECEGSVVSQIIASSSGLLDNWTSLSFTGSTPVGSQLLIDVLDGSTETALLSDLSLAASQPISLSSIDVVAHPTLKLRARLAGDAASPSSMADDFNHTPDVPSTNFDTVKWSDARLNGSTDPDAAVPVQTNLFTDGFETGLVPPWDSATMTLKTSTPSPHTGTYSAGWTYASSGSRETRYVTKDIDLAGISNPTIQFWYMHNNFSSTNDYVHVEYSTTGVNGTYTQLWTTTSTGSRTWTQTSAISLPTGTNAVRLAVSVNASGEYAYVDDVVIAGGVPGTQTDDWPKETGGQLQLRAEGTAFGGTADEGEFVYISPTQAAWTMTDDFDLRVKIPAINNLAGGTMKAGLMVRTASSETNALLQNAAMAGLYVTNTNIAFQYRAAGGGTTTTATTVAGSAPEWLLIERRGSVFTAKTSGDGSTWTTVGSGTLTTGSVTLVGMALTSSVSSTFSEATYDDFSVTGLTPPSTVTPVLADWTVTYEHYPLPTVGSLTCANCHNVHSVQKGTVGTAWQLIRASLPSNTKTNYAGTATQFCLECHDAAAPTTSANSATVLVPYSVEFSDKSSSPFFPEWDKTVTGADWASGGHASTTIKDLTGDFGCNTCHDPHASDNARLTALTVTGASTSANHLAATSRNNTTTYAEQNLCYACHNSRGAANCAAAGCHARSMAFLNAATPFAATYRHPVESTGKHSDTETAANLGTSNRHAECADCHDPHATKAGIHTVGDSSPGNVLRGVKGIKPTYPATSYTGKTGENWATMNVASSWSVERMTGDDTDYEAYVCFKCHSSYSGQPFSVTSGSGTYTSTDVAMEFNPSNASEHNVLGQRTVMETAFTVNGASYTWTKPADSAFLKTGWTSNSQVTCTDCHSNTTTTAARGPHGSSVKWMLDPAYPTNWRTTSLTSSNMSNTTNICAKCHTNLGSANNVHGDDHHQGSGDGNCINCHIGIPHGWKRPRLLGYKTDGIYATTGLTGFTLRSRTYNGWQEDGDCNDGCADSEHSGASTPLWP